MKLVTVSTPTGSTGKFRRLLTSMFSSPTDGPPKGVGDLLANHYKRQNVGCRALLERIDQLSLQAQIFGHIHEGYGEYQRGQALLINASTCNVCWRPASPPIIIDLIPSRRQDTDAR